jgi:hypothetical protein
MVGRVCQRNNDTKILFGVHMIIVGTCPVVVLARGQHIFYERAVISVCNVESFSKTSDCGLQEERDKKDIISFTH